MCSIRIFRDLRNAPRFTGWPPLSPGVASGKGETPRRYSRFSGTRRNVLFPACASYGAGVDIYSHEQYFIGIMTGGRIHEYVPRIVTVFRKKGRGAHGGSPPACPVWVRIL